ncbi:ATP-binding protein [Sphingomonas panni]|uniref:ATP-binding protein n=1 Tax=Sphingomonas panni TaxID=237612 RepID=UPI001F5B19B4|nr:ATP-binding protein [Sphingomonas panni]
MSDESVQTLGTYEEEKAASGYEPVAFQADSALIRELGERLVGAPHVALAELVKNAYDADATRCTIRLEKNRITVSDNGHGMEPSEFRDHWMRIGTQNKQRHGRSRLFGRNVSGSKGVGRLSAQFLAHKMQLITSAENSSDQPLHALVDWDAAVQMRELTEATAMVKIESQARTIFPEESATGTTVVMENLKHDWGKEAVEQLGQQLWMLQSPIPNFGRTRSGDRPSQDFQIGFSTDLEGLDESFATQMQAAMANAHAVITGEALRVGSNLESHVTVRFGDDEEYSQSFVDTPAFLSSAKWQIRVYNLSGRQAGNIPVQLAREYFQQFGVMMFDAGFRLPYYGIQSDWLGIEYDHSHRKVKSALLPDSMHVQRALNDLPSQGRLLGVVAIDTGQEARAATEDQAETGDYLKILVTRDRLVDNSASQQLRTVVRRSLDYYATRQRIKAARTTDIARPLESAAVRLRKIDQLIHEAVERFPQDDTILELSAEIQRLDTTVEQQSAADEAARSLLGPLASAGMAALAMEHENIKEVRIARSHIRALRRVATRTENKELEGIAGNLEGWLQRFDDSRKLFAPLLDAEDRDAVEPLNAANVVRETLRGIAPLVEHISFDVDVAKDLTLPSATFAEWYALVQNVVLNAANAMIDTRVARQLIAGHREGRWSVLRISDLGNGIDLSRADRFFAPFEREQGVSTERRALALGGMGLGLTIVRMIADQRGCTVGFVQPEPGWSTTFEMRWRG